MHRATSLADQLMPICVVQIYNETITDLLKPTAVTLQLREDVTRGCFVDGLSEEIVLNGKTL